MNRVRAQNKQNDLEEYGEEENKDHIMTDDEVEQQDENEQYSLKKGKPIQL